MAASKKKVITEWDADLYSAWDFFWCYAFDIVEVQILNRRGVMALEM
jgi:hypothetical protein